MHKSIMNLPIRDHEHLTEQTLSCSLEKQMGSMSSVFPLPSYGHVRVTAHTLLPHIHSTVKTDYKLIINCVFFEIQIL